MDTKPNVLDDQLKLDYKIVNIDDVLPNSWNPKKTEEYNERYQEVLNSIKTYGLRDAIVVREKDDKYEIIDGFHRHKACKESGYSKVIINNQGIVDDATAKRLTIVFQKVQVPFDEVMYSNLLKELNAELGEEEILATLPIKEPELEGYLNMSNFNFDEEYKDTNLGVEVTQKLKGMTILFNEEQADIVRKAVDEVRRQADDPEMSPARAIELISADYLAGLIPDDKPEDLVN